MCKADSVLRSSNTMINTSQKMHYNRDGLLYNELWTDGLVCAFEFIKGTNKEGSYKSGWRSNEVLKKQVPPRYGVDNSLEEKDGNMNIKASSNDSNSSKPNSQSGCFNVKERFSGSYWLPIGWARISELVQTVEGDSGWATQSCWMSDEEDDITVAEIAAPYWERPIGPTWWCNITAGHPFVNSWLGNAQWLHPAISVALRDESKLISERMKHLLYEVPVRVAGGLLFELLGQSAGDPLVNEDDIPVVIRSWQAQHFLVTAMHAKGPSFMEHVNVLGIAEVQELLAAGGVNIPKTIHEVIALLACRLARWDDRLFRKSIFGAADEIELKFMNRRTHEDMHLFSIILNQEIRRLSNQVIRVKWSLHAREEIIFELVQHLRGNTTRSLLEGIRKSTRDMIQEQEAVRDRLFTIQDVMQSTVRASLQDESLRVTHNLGVFGGCGLVLSIITGLFGINVDGIPGSQSTPYAFGVFTGILFLLGIVLIGIGLLYLGMKKPTSGEEVEVRKLELEELVRMFQQEAESHAQVQQKGNNNNNRSKISSAAVLPDGEGYILIK